MSFIEVKPTEEYKEENGIYPVERSAHVWVYTDKTGAILSTNNYTTEALLLRHGRVMVWS